MALRSFKLRLGPSEEEALAIVEVLTEWGNECHALSAGVQAEAEAVAVAAAPQPPALIPDPTLDAGLIALRELTGIEVPVLRPVQMHALRAFAAGKDVLCLAPTGSGDRVGSTKYGLALRQYFC